MKKVLSIILILACLLTCLPLTAGAVTGGRLIALTFDDGPGRYTDQLLDGLAERGVKATFFTLGMRAEEYSKKIRRMYEEGHQIADHSYDHPNLNELSNSQITWQVGHTMDVLNGIIGKDFRYLVRPPYGSCNDRVASVLNTPAIIWSVDPNDWKDRNAETVKKRVVSNAFDGAIILCHDIYSTSVKGILNAIDILKSQGYEFVTVNELFRRRGIPLENGKRYYSAKPNGTDLGPVKAPEPKIDCRGSSLEISFDAPSGLDIYYTTDGSNPLHNGTRYTGPFSIAGGSSLQYFAAYNLNGSRSENRMLTVPEMPEIRTDHGKIILENKAQGFRIHYTTDGSLPAAFSPAYKEPIELFDGALRFCICSGNTVIYRNLIYVTADGNLFWDVPSNEWYAEIVNRAVSLHIFNGVGQYSFAPEKGVTRAMFVTTLYRTAQQLGKDVSFKNQPHFDDLREDWYRDAVSWANENKIVLGYEDGNFRPDHYISREEMCVILDRMLLWLGQKTEHSELTFSDRDQISDWARESVGNVSGIGLILGREHNCFAPQDTAVRAEAAAVLLRLYDYLKK